MARRKAADEAFAKALALWEAPEGAGEARVCIASTFTFRADFFETECLGRFLGMDAHPAESDAVSYMVEREEKLAAARVTVLVDRQHAVEKESLRWDVLGVLLHRAIQHSKISLLAWANHVRVIVGSGNLTEPGYRRNLEVFGALDLNRREGGDRRAIEGILDFLSELVDASVGNDGADTPKARAKGAVAAVRALIAGWPQVDAENPLVILGGPGRKVLAQVAEAWPSDAPPRTAYVVSPFFDSDGSEALGALLEAMAKRRPRDITFDVRTESGAEGGTRVFAPLPMMKLAAAQAGLTVRTVSREQKGELRDLHAKMIYLNNDRWRMVLAGSSNFTRAGLGVRGNANFEANLVYRVRDGDPGAGILDAVWPEVSDAALDIESKDLIWDPRGEEEEGMAASPPLPAAFQEASFVPGDPAALAITLRDPLPKEWSIHLDAARRLWSSSAKTAAGEHTLTWTDSAIPFVLQVTWSHEKGVASASWPVNVSNPAKLPPPEVLRTLTLEELLQVLASTRPMPQAVAEVLARRKLKKEQGDANLDPLRRFDSQSFLLRRTKRLSAALERLRERLERPASSREAYDWRLFGPVGPIVLAEGYVRDTSPGEAKFCLAEIALCLRRVRADKAAVDGLSRNAVNESLSKAIDELAQRAVRIPPVPALDRYAQAAFAEAGR